MALGVEMEGVREMPIGAHAGDVPRVGRRPSTSRGELEAVALELFTTRGFDETSVEDIAAAVGVGRRTAFRYFASKNDLVWGDFEGELARFRRWFETCPDDVPLMEAIREAVVAFNQFPRGVEESHRRRMRLILTTPALQAHSTLRYAEWRGVVTDFAARRLGVPVGALLPRLIGYTALAAAVAAYEQWLRDEGSDLVALLDEALRAIAGGFAELR